MTQNYRLDKGGFINRNKKIYMDGAATMPTDPEVIESMLACLNNKELFANPSSVHVSGRDAMQKIEKARVVLETTMREVETKYAEAEKKLDSKKKKQVQKIIKENHDDPDAITEKLASLTGFDIYVELF